MIIEFSKDFLPYFPFFSVCRGRATYTGNNNNMYDNLQIDINFLL